MKCALGFHNWMGWSLPHAVGGQVLQQRLCRRCGKIIMREVTSIDALRSAPQLRVITGGKQ
jgi:hypothetical protein